MTKHSLETKLEAARAYLDGTESFKDRANELRQKKGMSPVQYRTHAQEAA